MLLPLATPEIVMGSALFLVFTNLYTAIPLGRPAPAARSRDVLDLLRRGDRPRADALHRHASTRSPHKTRARHPCDALRTVLVPLLMPAVFASAMIVFAGSLDDFVVSSFLSADASSVTVPIKLYSAVRNAPSPALNALATIMLAGTTLALFFAWLVLRRRSRGLSAAGARLDRLRSTGHTRSRR